MSTSIDHRTRRHCDRRSLTLDNALTRTRSDDGASWRVADSDGNQQAVRVLFFREQSETLRDLLAGDRLQGLRPRGSFLFVRCAHGRNLKPGDALEPISKEEKRAARARLTSAQDRIAEASAGAEKSGFVDLHDDQLTVGRGVRSRRARRRIHSLKHRDAHLAAAEDRQRMHTMLHMAVFST